MNKRTDNKNVQQGENVQDVHPKGTMREPPQTPGAVAAEGELREVREALQEVEETEGDWSKGG
jgi:hypothetical protein